MNEQFSEPEPNVIASTEGFSVKVLGQVGLRYTEGTRSVWIDSEVLAEPRTIAISTKTIRFWEGLEPGEVRDKDRDRIVNNIKRAFEACGYELQVQEPFDWTSVALPPPTNASDEDRRREALIALLGAGMSPSPDKALLVSALADARRSVAALGKREADIGEWLDTETRFPGIRENAATVAALELPAMRAQVASRYSVKYPERVHLVDDYIRHL